MRAGAQLVVEPASTAAAVELVDGVVVLFALGNGAYGSRGRFVAKNAPPYGLVAGVEVLDARVAAVELRLLLVDNKVVHFQPRPATDEPALAFLHSLLEPALRWHPTPGGYRCELEA